ncbi:MAG: phenylalanine--tRNA ligase subunit alpha [Rhodobacteraceae bacterium]|nr:phenylalanine--tRNA ligase subunit alpha [Paracoccaceae bacterium]
MKSIEILRTEYLTKIKEASSDAELEEVRILAMGKKGEITLKLRQLGQMDLQQRKDIAPLLNALKNEINQAIANKREALVEEELDAQIRKEWLDITLPGRSRRIGSIHPVNQTIDQAVAIFSAMGFSYAEGPQIETDWHNFDALNMPPEHPARQEHDTFFIKPKDTDNGQPNVLRTHTSPVQIRSMTENGVPIRVIAPGRVYRCDYDQTHTPMFHQIEGLAIDTDLTMANLKWVLEEFCRAFFEIDNVELRFRASHFPFTEPSAEVDIKCSWGDGQLKIGEGNDWLEILGCGMVHPNVLNASGVDLDKYQGFAFGMGLDRIAMLKYGIPDLRAFFESDIRWLRHYGFSPVDTPALHSGLSL